MSDDGVDLTDFADAPSDDGDERPESDADTSGRDDTVESDGDTASDTTESSAGADSDGGPDPAVDPETVSPVTGTFVSGPDERACARCETAVRTLWHDADADGYVCADCKDW